MIFRIIFTLIFSCTLLSFNKNEVPKTLDNSNKTAVLERLESKATDVYRTLNTNGFSLPRLEIFKETLSGYWILKEKGLIHKDILTVIDFTLSSNTKRLWVIDLKTNIVLFHSLVSHGMNSGDEFAYSFSNTVNSLKSSLGFYTTGEIYNGKHGISLRLDGLEKGVNDKARTRGIVIHSADYVSDSFARENKRLGRSSGCPALPTAVTKEIINTIKDKTCLFIYHSSRNSLRELI